MFAEDRVKQTGALSLQSLHFIRGIRHLAMNHLLMNLISYFKEYRVLMKFAKIKRMLCS